MEDVGVGTIGGEFAVGVAGPVSGGHSRLTNLPWAVDEAELAGTFGFRRTRVLNDLEATGWAIGSLRGRQIATLTPSLRVRTGNAAVIAAGTGLGMAILVQDGARWLVSASEGGHQDFAPRDPTEEALLRFVRRVAAQTSDFISILRQALRQTLAYVAASNY